ncbi:MAG: hypothetical protein LR001_09240 [Clostridiales bacterium]|nr:hypothetical protein [Clostridiales bacterium]
MAKHKLTLIKSGDEFAMQMFKAYCKKTPPTNNQIAWYRSMIYNTHSCIKLGDKNLLQSLIFCDELDAVLKKTIERIHTSETFYPTLGIKPDIFSLTALLAACKVNPPSSDQAVHYIRKMSSFNRHLNLVADIKNLTVEIAEELQPLVKDNYKNFRKLLHISSEIGTVFNSKWGSSPQNKKGEE